MDFRIHGEVSKAYRPAAIPNRQRESANHYARIFHKNVTAAASSASSLSHKSISKAASTEQECKQARAQDSIRLDPHLLEPLQELFNLRGHTQLTDFYSLQLGDFIQLSYLVIWTQILEQGWSSNDPEQIPPPLLHCMVMRGWIFPKALPQITQGFINWCTQNNLPSNKQARIKQQLIALEKIAQVNIDRTSTVMKCLGLPNQPLAQVSLISAVQFVADVMASILQFSSMAHKGLIQLIQSYVQAIGKNIKHLKMQMEPSQLPQLSAKLQARFVAHDAYLTARLSFLGKGYRRLANTRTFTQSAAEHMHEASAIFNQGLETQEEQNREAIYEGLFLLDLFREHKGLKILNAYDNLQQIERLHVTTAFLTHFIESLTLLETHYDNFPTEDQPTSETWKSALIGVLETVMRGSVTQDIQEKVALSLQCQACIRDVEKTGEHQASSIKFFQAALQRLCEECSQRYQLFQQELSVLISNRSFPVQQRPNPLLELIEHFKLSLEHLYQTILVNPSRERSIAEFFSGFACVLENHLRNLPLKDQVYDRRYDTLAEGIQLSNSGDIWQNGRSESDILDKSFLLLTVVECKTLENERICKKLHAEMHQIFERLFVQLEERPNVARSNNWMVIVDEDPIQESTAKEDEAKEIESALPQDNLDKVAPIDLSALPVTPQGLLGVYRDTLAQCYRIANPLLAPSYTRKQNYSAYVVARHQQLFALESLQSVLSMLSCAETQADRHLLTSFLFLWGHQAIEQGATACKLEANSDLQNRDLDHNLNQLLPDTFAHNVWVLHDPEATRFLRYPFSCAREWVEKPLTLRHMMNHSSLEDINRQEWIKELIEAQSALLSSSKLAMPSKQLNEITLALTNKLSSIDGKSSSLSPDILHKDLATKLIAMEKAIREIGEELEKRISFGAGNPILSRGETQLKNMKHHLYNLSGLMSLIQHFPQKCHLASHAIMGLISAQYLAENLGIFLSISHYDPIYDHRLSMYSHCFQLDQGLTAKQKVILQSIDVEKGSEYPCKSLPKWLNPIAAGTMTRMSEWYLHSKVAARDSEEFTPQEYQPKDLETMQKEVVDFLLQLSDLSIALIKNNNLLTL